MNECVVHACVSFSVCACKETHVHVCCRSNKWTLSVFLHTYLGFCLYVLAQALSRNLEVTS